MISVRILEEGFLTVANHHYRFDARKARAALGSHKEPIEISASGNTVTIRLPDSLGGLQR